MKNRKHNGCGNREAQKKRRKERGKPQRKMISALLIDGNISCYFVAYCRRKEGFLTPGLTETHRCYQRNCEMLEQVEQA